MTIHRLIREPLIHFFVIGAALFLIYDAVDAPPDDPAEVVVSEERIAAIKARFERTWRRPPTAPELDGLIDNWLREELLYREGLALGLDRDDPVIRRRIAQKMGFVAEALSSELPTDRVLNAWLAENPEHYRNPDRYTLRQIYVDAVSDGLSLDDIIPKVRTELGNGADWRDLGQQTLLPAQVDDIDDARIAAIFGAAFARSLADVPLREWAGPVESGYGQHLVYIEKRTEGSLPPLDEIRQRVAQDYLQAQADRAEREFVAALKDRYEIRIKSDMNVPDREVD